MLKPGVHSTWIYVRTKGKLPDVSKPLENPVINDLSFPFRVPDKAVNGTTYSFSRLFPELELREQHIIHNL
jgi:hypothetical protein